MPIDPEIARLESILASAHTRDSEIRREARQSFEAQIRASDAELQADASVDVATKALWRMKAVAWLGAAMRAESEVYTVDEVV